MSLLDDDLQTVPTDRDDGNRPEDERDTLPSWAGTAIDFAAFWPVDGRAGDITIDLTGEAQPSHARTDGDGAGRDAVSAREDVAGRDVVAWADPLGVEPATVEVDRSGPVEPVDVPAASEVRPSAEADATPAASRRSPAPAQQSPAQDSPAQESPARPSPARKSPARPSSKPAPPGLRIRRVRLTSLAAVAAVFYILLYVVLVGTSVALWNVGVNLGLVDGLENLITTSLGVDSFEVAGPALFDLVLVGAGVVCGFGLLVTVLLGLVYNATGALFGGLAVETGPLRKRRKTFSLLTSTS